MGTIVVLAVWLPIIAVGLSFLTAAIIRVASVGDRLPAILVEANHIPAAPAEGDDAGRAA